MLWERLAGQSIRPFLSEEIWSFHNFVLFTRISAVSLWTMAVSPSLASKVLSVAVSNKPHARACRHRTGAGNIMSGRVLFFKERERLRGRGRERGGKREREGERERGGEERKRERVSECVCVCVYVCVCVCVCVCVHVLMMTASLCPLLLSSPFTAPIH